MGDLDHDTRVEGADGHYSATLDEDWNIWGPNGGYLGVVLLRAAGAHAELARPASLGVQFLARAEFGPVSLDVRTVRRTRRAEAVAVTMTQGERAVATAQAWFVDVGLAGLDHQVAPVPDIPPADALRTWDQLRADYDIPRPTFRFWDNIDYRPADFVEDWPPPGPLAPVSEGWFAFRPRAVFDDPLVDAGRSVVVLDTMTWNPASRPHAWKWDPESQPWVAPSLDLHVRFHQFVPESAQLLVRAESPAGAGGLVTAEGRAWADDGTLLASSGAQMLCTPVPPT